MPGRALAISNFFLWSQPRGMGRFPTPLRRNQRHGVQRSVLAPGLGQSRWRIGGESNLLADLCRVTAFAEGRRKKGSAGEGNRMSLRFRGEMSALGLEGTRLFWEPGNH